MGSPGSRSLLFDGAADVPKVGAKRECLIACPRCEELAETQLLAERDPGANAVRLAALRFPYGPGRLDDLGCARRGRKRDAVIVCEHDVVGGHGRVAELCAY